MGKMGISWDIFFWGYHEIGCSDYIYDLTHKHEDLAGQKCWYTENAKGCNGEVVSGVVQH